jgi:hypothetical protein
MKRAILFLAIALIAVPVFAQVNTMKVYLSPQEFVTYGDFSFWRNKLNSYIDVQQGESFQEIDNPARHYSICFLTARSVTHATISGDPEIISLTPSDVAPSQIASALDTPVNNLPSAFRTSVQDALEAKGISFAWVGASNTVRDVLRYLIRVHFTAQRADGEQVSAILDLMKLHLDDPVNTISAAKRKQIKDWMSDKGLDTSWIGAQTDVRQVLHNIVNNLGYGKIKFGGQDF